MIFNWHFLMKHSIIVRAKNYYYSQLKFLINVFLYCFLEWKKVHGQTKNKKDWRIRWVLAWGSWCTTKVSSGPAILWFLLCKTLACLLLEASQLKLFLSLRNRMLIPPIWPSTFPKSRLAQWRFKTAHFAGSQVKQLQLEHLIQFKVHKQLSLLVYSYNQLHLFLQIFLVLSLIYCQNINQFTTVGR